MLKEENQAATAKPGSCGNQPLKWWVPCTKPATPECSQRSICNLPVLLLVYGKLKWLLFHHSWR